MITEHDLEAFGYWSYETQEPEKTPTEMVKEYAKTSGQKPDTGLYAALIEEEKRAAEFGAEREKRMKGQEEKLSKTEKQNFNMTLIDMGLAMMAGKSPDALQNIAAGAQQGLKG